MSHVEKLGILFRILIKRFKEIYVEFNLLKVVSFYVTLEVSIVVVELIKVEIEEAHMLHALQKKAFQKLLDKYQDYETNPANESIERLTEKIQDGSFFKIISDNKFVGAIRIVQRNNSNWISPIFILPEYQGKGIAQKAMVLAEDLFSEYNVWELQTILQEKGNCYLYEKIGYKRTEFERQINSRMTLIGYKK